MEVSSSSEEHSSVERGLRSTLTSTSPRSPRLTGVTIHGDSHSIISNKDQIINVRVLSPGRNTLSLRVSEELCSSDLQLMIKSAYSLEDNAKLRLLFAGRVLEDDVELSSIVDPSSPTLTLHCAVTFPPPPTARNNQNTNNNMNGRRDRRQPAPADDQEPILGFDRLRFMGFSDEEIQLARSQFRTSFMNRMRASRGRAAARLQISERDYRTLEERFMSGEEEPNLPQTRGIPQNANVPQQNVVIAPEEIEQEGTHIDLVFGLIMGFLLGLFVLYWLWERTTKHLTRRRVVGFIIGVVANLFIATVHIMKK